MKVDFTESTLNLSSFKFFITREDLFKSMQFCLTLVTDWLDSGSAQSSKTFW